MTEKKEAYQAYYEKDVSTIDKVNKFTISAKADNMDEAIAIFLKIRNEMEPKP